MGYSSEPRSWSRTLPAGPDTAGEARWFLWEALKDEQPLTDMDTALLLTSEVASNAARHGREPIELSVILEDEGLRVSIFDHGSGFDPEDVRRPLDRPGDDPMQSSGWGVNILDRLATDWGVDRRDDATEVWFRL